MKTKDGVDLSVIDVGDPAKPALLFIHGLSKSALSWSAQLSSAGLLAKYRLVVVDLRGHELSQGAFGAMANDIDAVIDGLSLRSPVLVGLVLRMPPAEVADYMAAPGTAGADVVSGMADFVQLAQ